MILTRSLNESFNNSQLHPLAVILSAVMVVFGWSFANQWLVVKFYWFIIYF